MRGGVLKAERRAAVQAIETLPSYRAWHWERDAFAGPYCSEDICLGHARTSDGLVLILAEDLSPITHCEYREAKSAGVPCYIMLMEPAAATGEVTAFIAAEQSHCITKKFRNLSELRSHITEAVLNYALMAGREKILRTTGKIRQISLRQRLAGVTMRGRAGRRG